MFYRAVIINIIQFITTDPDTLINGIEDPDINPHTYEQLIFLNEGKNTYWKKKTASSKMVLVKLDVCKSSEHK